MLVSAKQMKKFRFTPYEQCPCGNEKKYKFCCYLSSKNSVSEAKNYSPERIVYESQRMYRETDFKICFAFDTKQCDEIIGAHSLQNNGVLDKVAIDGHVYNLVFDVVNRRPFLKFNKIGKNQA